MQEEQNPIQSTTPPQVFYPNGQSDANTPPNPILEIDAAQQSPDLVTAQTSPVVDQAPVPQVGASVSWTASEYVSHQKGSGWYVSLGTCTAVGAGLVYLTTKDYLSIGLVVIAAIIFAVMASRQPKELDYAVSDRGIRIATKEFPYESFKSFSVVDEGAVSSVVFMPLKRFMPPMTMYYAPSDEDHILAVIGDYLPFEERSHDIVERAMRKIRF